MRQKISNHYPRLTGVTKHIRYPYWAAKCKKKHLANDYWISMRLSQKTTELACNNDVPNHDYGTKNIYSR